MKPLKGILGFIPAAAWMGMIYYFSSVPADDSTVQSMSVTEQIIEIFAHITGASEVKLSSWVISVEPYVRKLAHMSEYALLFILLFIAFRFYIKSYKKNVLISFLICVLYACTDEWHQTFIDGRAGMPADVLIDACGAAIVIIVYCFIRKLSHS